MRGGLYFHRTGEKPIPANFLEVSNSHVARRATNFRLKLAIGHQGQVVMGLGSLLTTQQPPVQFCFSRSEQANYCLRRSGGCGTDEELRATELGLFSLFARQRRTLARITIALPCAAGTYPS